MKKITLLICINLLPQSHLHASSYTIDEDFEPVFKRPASVITSLTKITTGTTLALIGDYLSPHEECDNFSDHLISEGPSVIGHTLIMGGMCDLLHWGYDKFMHTVWRTPAHQKKRNNHPRVNQKREKELDQRVDLSWNRISTGFQIGTSFINSAIGSYYYAEPTAQIFLGTVDATSSQSIIYPLCFSLSCVSLFYSAKRAKTYLTHKKKIDDEPPLISFAAGLGQGILGSHLKTMGHIYIFAVAKTANDCQLAGFTPIEYSEKNSNFLNAGGYWTCVLETRSLRLTRTGEFLEYYSKFKMLHALQQIGINAIDLFEAQETTLETERVADTQTPPFNQQPEDKHKTHTASLMQQITSVTNPTAEGELT